MEKTLKEIKEIPIEYKVTPGKSIHIDPIFKLVKNKGEQWLKHRKKTHVIEMDNVNFHDDRFELMMDARGYRPEDIKCTVTAEAIQILANRGDLNQTGQQKSVSTNRHYQLNRNVIPEQAVCVLSREGILLISVPWAVT